MYRGRCLRGIYKTNHTLTWHLCESWSQKNTYKIITCCSSDIKTASGGEISFSPTWARVFVCVCPSEGFSLWNAIKQTRISHISTGRSVLLNPANRKLSLWGESIQTDSPNEWQFTKIEESSNESTIMLFPTAAAHFSDEWDYGNMLPQERVFLQY